MTPQEDRELEPLRRDGECRSVATLPPIMGVVFLAYLVIGLATAGGPASLLHGLRLGTFFVGLHR